MAEAAVTFQLAAAIIGLIQFTTALLKRLDEYRDIIDQAPETFRSLTIRLPLLSVTLDRIKQQTADGNVKDDLAQALLPMVEEMVRQIEYVEGQLRRITPGRTASTRERGMKALKSLASESKINNALSKIHEYINYLVLHQTTTNVDVGNSTLSELRALRANFSATAPVGMGPSITVLHQAIRQGDFKSVRAMWEMGSDFNARDEVGRSALHVAADAGQMKLANFVQEKVKNPNAQDDKGQTPYHVAVIAGHVKVALLLLENGAREDVKDDNGKTASDYVSQHFIPLWKLRHGSDLEARDVHTGNTALIQAVCQHDVSAVTELLAAGASVKAVNDRQSTALAEACKRGHQELIGLLLKAGANPNVTDCSGWSPFTRCIWAHQSGALTCLIKDGRVDLDSIKTPKGHSAIAEAMFQDQWHAVRILLEAGAKPQLTGDCSRNTLLKEAIRSCRDEEVIRLLIRSGADVNEAAGDGQTPMSKAVERKDWSSMELLLENGASADGMQDGYPYISRLAYNKANPQYIRMLAKHGADVNAMNLSGWTALHETAFHGPPDLVCELLELGADLNIRYKSLCDHQNVPILVATVWGTGRIMQTITDLISYGANLEDQDNHGWTALRAAVEENNDQAACLLFLKGANAQARAADGQTPASRAPSRRVPEFTVLMAASERTLTLRKTD